MLFAPEQVKELFQGSNTRLHAGEANALLGPIVGERSVLLLDGAEHLRHRRLLLPPFHGRRMLAHVQTMRECADEEIDRWPVGEPFTLLEHMQALTLRVILRAVNDARLIISGQTHRLRPVKFRVLKCGQPKQPIPQRRG